MCTNIFLTPCFVNVLPMKAKGEAGNVITVFVNEWSIMWCLQTYKAKEEIHKDWGRV